MTENSHNDNNDSRKGVFEALLSAGGQIGDVASDFASRFKADRVNPEEGKHALQSENTPIGDQVKQAVAKARDSFKDADDNEQRKSAGASFLGDAESIIKDLAGSASRAAQGTKDSEATQELREKLSQVRQGFDDSVSQIRERAAKSGDEQEKQDSEGFIEEMRGRLDGLINKVGDSFSNGKEDGEVVSEPAPDIIEGEVVEDDRPQ